MDEWIVSIEVRSPDSSDEVDLGAVSGLTATLSDLGASAHGGGDAYGVTVRMSGFKSQDAVATAVDRFEESRTKLELPGWPVVRCDLVERAEALRSLSEDALPELLDVSGPTFVGVLPNVTEPFHRRGIVEVLVGTEAETADSPLVLAGTSEAVELVGVSRQRFRILSSRPDFPRPIATLAATPVWFASAVEDYAVRRNTQPGRPPSADWVLDESED